MDFNTTLSDFKKNNRIIYEFIAGSHAYGLNVATSDEDIRGIFITPKKHLLNLKFKSPPQQIQDTKHDTVYYSLDRFFELCKDNNPNIQEFLVMPEDKILIKSPVMQKIIDNRAMFISKKAYHTFAGYAYAQCDRCKGQNKLINNPKPKDPPKKEEFCWIIDEKSMVDKIINKVGMGNVPCRPKKMIDNYGIDFLSKYHCTSLEHSSNMFRIYYYGDKSKGIFRNGQLVTDSVSLHDERTRFKGILIYNEVEYDKACKEWKQYWEWVENRNENRWKLQEDGKLSYDVKNIMHALRLIHSGKNILLHGEPIVRVEEPMRSFLMDIRAGKYSYEAVMEKVEYGMKELDELYKTSKLQAKVDEDKINELYLECLEMIE